MRRTICEAAPTGFRRWLGPGRLAPMMGIALAALGACASPAAITGSEAMPPAPSTPLAAASKDDAGPQSFAFPQAGDTGTGQAGAATPTSPPPFATPGQATRPIRMYQWQGTVAVASTNGGLELRRDCDVWTLLPASDGVKAKLQQLVGKHVIVWGQVAGQPVASRQQAISVQSAFGPQDPMPMTLVAIPEHPCPPVPPRPVPPNPTPAPTGTIVLGGGETAFRGTLVWEGGRPYLATPAGRIDVTLPQRTDAGAQAGGAGGAALAPAPSMDVVAAGQWRQTAQGLTLAARAVQPWPAAIAIQECQLVPAAQLNAGEAAVRGVPVTDGSRTVIRTPGGAVQLLFPAPARPDVSAGEVVAIGVWKVSGDGVALSVRAMRPAIQPCPPPPPLPQPGISLLPGEIAAIGTLVWENGQPLLSTLSGRIAFLLPPRTAQLAETRPATPPGDVDVAPPESIRANMQVLAVGKWSISQSQLVMAVRSLRPWPVPPPIPPPPPVGGQGVLTGTVRIGPLCPVEPCRTPAPDVYSSRSLVAGRASGQSVSIPLNSDGSFKVSLEAGEYNLGLTDCSYLGCKNALPRSVTIRSQQVTTIEINIDTGIR